MSSAATAPAKVISLQVVAAGKRGPDPQRSRSRAHLAAAHALVSRWEGARLAGAAVNECWGKPFAWAALIG